jgi:hypothetical protein
LISYQWRHHQVFTPAYPDSAVIRLLRVRPVEPSIDPDAQHFGAEFETSLGDDHAEELLNRRSAEHPPQQVAHLH